MSIANILNAMYEEDNIMSDKEIERQNFLSWYSMYATVEDIEKAETINKPAVDRLFNEYSYEIERLNMSRSSHEKLF
ncbi:MAG: hypothetical protein GY777_31435 [Candidatus Brocadiaceae bacterium]|nr:hypothetical protein [Candidatus Brocadiaceae bacterium]